MPVGVLCERNRYRLRLPGAGDGLNLTPTVKPFEPASRDRDMRFHIEDVDLNGYDSFASRNILVILIIITLLTLLVLFYVCEEINRMNRTIYCLKKFRII